MYDETQMLFYFLSGLVLLLLMISAFYIPDHEKRPHKAVSGLLKSVKRKRAKSKYTKPKVKQAVLAKLKAPRWQRCSNCGTGSPQWSAPELVDLSDLKRNVVFSVALQTCQKCGHVQFYSADWLDSNPGS